MGVALARSMLSRGDGMSQVGERREALEECGWIRELEGNFRGESVSMVYSVVNAGCSHVSVARAEIFSGSRREARSWDGEDVLRGGDAASRRRARSSFERPVNLEVYCFKGVRRGLC